MSVDVTGQMELVLDERRNTHETPKYALAHAPAGKEGNPRKVKRQMAADPMLGIGTGHCRCYQCGEYFNSLGSFDKHQRLDNGRVVCIHPASITDGKGNPKPMILNDRGYWVLSLMGDRKFYER